MWCGEEKTEKRRKGRLLGQCARQVAKRSAGKSEAACQWRARGNAAGRWDREICPEFFRFFLELLQILESFDDAIMQVVQFGNNFLLRQCGNDEFLIR